MRLRHADSVVVMGDGMVLEQGEPGELLESGGAFAELWGKASDDNVNSKGKLPKNDP